MRARIDQTVYEDDDFVETVWMQRCRSRCRQIDDVTWCWRFAKGFFRDLTLIGVLWIDESTLGDSA
jgi:hypothetical protein